jgi:hypothetical protein
MSAEIVNVVDGVLTVQVSGKLAHGELVEVQRAAADILSREGRLRLLVLAQNFAGWERAGDWGDVSFQAENDGRIERMAIVGDRKWEELALMFTAQGMRPFPIEYFEPTQAAAARTWLAQRE